MGYFVLLLASIGIYAAAGMCIGVGQSRTNSFFIAAGATFAIGSYSAAILMTNCVLDLFALATLPLILGAVFGVIFSVLTGYHDQRVVDILGLSVLVIGGALTRNWFDPAFEAGSWQSLTNGAFGLTGFEDPTIFGLASLEGRTAGLLVSGLSMLYCYWVARIAEQSLWGSSIVAIRDDRLQAALDGHRISYRHVGLGALIGSGIGVAGAAYTLTYKFVDPAVWGIETAIGLCLIPLIWPFGALWIRAFVGATAFVMIPEVLSQLSVASPYETYIRNILFFVIALSAGVYVRQDGTEIYEPPKIRAAKR